MEKYNYNLGKLGEKIAEKYLIKNKYTIIEKNFYSKQGEIDIIAEEKDTREIVFIEVKTRTNSKYGRPKDAVTINKRKHMYKAAEYYILKNKIAKKDITLDVVEIYANSEKNIKIIHLERAIEDKP